LQVATKLVWLPIQCVTQIILMKNALFRVLPGSSFVLHLQAGHHCPNYVKMTLR